MANDPHSGQSAATGGTAHALVTGASRGLGLAFATQLLAAGAAVTLAVRDFGSAQAAEALAAAHPRQSRVIRVDYSDHSSLPACLAGSGLRRLDLLINCGSANIAHGQPEVASKGPLQELESTALVQLFEVNVAGPVALCRAVLPLLVAAQGLVANISTSRASISMTDRPGSFSYAVSKAALNMATRKLAAELGPSGVTVVAVDPGWIRTRMGGERAPRLPEEAAHQVLQVLLRPNRPLSGCFVDAEGNDVPW